MDIFDLGFIMAIIAVISFVISTGITDIFLDTAKIIETRIFIVVYIIISFIALGIYFLYKFL